MDTSFFWLPLLDLNQFVQTAERLRYRTFAGATFAVPEIRCSLLLRRISTAAAANLLPVSATGKSDRSHVVL